jgi:HK97 gp10 family phage protein
MEVTGLANTLRKFAELEVASKVGVELGQRAAGESVQERAKSLVPVDTGTLQASIETHEDGGDVLVGTVGVPYSVFVEFGTANAAAQPFLRPAADSVDAPKVIGVALSAAIRAVVGL